MRELGDAIARGALARVTTLRNERLTRDAQRLLEVLLDPLGSSLGKVPDAPEPHSSQEVLRELVELERAQLQMRQERPEAIEKARFILAGILDRVGPKAPMRYLDGEPQASFLSDLASAFSQIGDERTAIDISSYLIAQVGLPANASQISEYVHAHPRAQTYRRRLATQLNNLTVRRVRLAYIAALSDDTATARDQLDQAHIEGQQALALRPDEDAPAIVASRLMSRANNARIEFERTALLIDDRDQRERRLEEIEEVVRALLIETYEASFIRPVTRLVRAGLLGMVLLERALIREQRGDTSKAESLAWTARIAMKPHQDLFMIDADEALAFPVRYSDACRISGAERTALAVLQRSRARLVLYRGTDSPALKALDASIPSGAPSRSTRPESRSRP